MSELARVVRDGGRVVLADLAAAWLPQKERARSPRRIQELLEGTGLVVERRETLYRLALVAPLVRAFIASR